MSGLHKLIRFTALWLPLLAVAAIASCDFSRAGGAGFVPVNPSGWLYGDTLSFVLPGPDTAMYAVDTVAGAPGRLAVSVCHSDNYSYSGVWLEVIASAPDTAYTDTLLVPFADKYGKWYGTGIGTSITVTDTLARDYLFRPGAKVKVRHIMRVDTLRGIEQIGVIFVPAKDLWKRN